MAKKQKKTVNTLKAKEKTHVGKAVKKPTKTAKAPVKPEVKSIKKTTPSTLPLVKSEKVKKTKLETKTAKVKPEVSVKLKEDKKKSKKAKKAAKQEFDLGDDLIGDDDLGSEEIPDLTDFVEEEIADSEVETDSDLDSEDADVLAAEGPKAPDDEVVLTDAEGRRYCRVRDCDQISVVEGYCRYHYLLLWKKIQIRRKILTDGKLERYVEELTSRYPDKFLEMIKKDLRTEKDFVAAIAELEIDESAVDNEFEDEAQSYVEEIRGMSETSASLSDDDEF